MKILFPIAIASTSLLVSCAESVPEPVAPVAPVKKTIQATKIQKATPTKKSPQITTAAPKEWNAWAAWVEEQHSAGDAHGHGPDVGSKEWAVAISSQLGVTDSSGHGPDLKSAEWRSAVEFKLRNR